MKCNQCNGERFEEDPARGDMICVECGAVASENAVTAAVEYVENAGGTTSALGNFVSAESQMASFRESRYVTEQRARKRIETICGQLRLGADVATSAFRYYQSALFRGFTRGRSAMQLAAACIYIAARLLRVNLMLLDLSDAVAINVYHVGRTYVDLKRKLNLALPEVDPCLFVERFASQLDFEEKTATVATTAMRLLQRMKKDWISTGRRPSGLAAASLLVAARIHEFNRTEEDVAKVARISQMTARKRLVEFSKTPSSALSIEAFFTVDYDEEQDPPCFGQPSQKRRLDLKDLDMEQVSAEIEELGRRIDQELDELASKRKMGIVINDPVISKSKGLKHLVEADSPLAKDENGDATGEDVVDLVNSSASAQEDEDSDSEAVHKRSGEGPSSPKRSRLSGLKVMVKRRQVLRDVLDGVVDPEILDSCVEDLELITGHSGQQLCEMVSATHQYRNARDAAASADIDAKAEQQVGSLYSSGVATSSPSPLTSVAAKPSPSLGLDCAPSNDTYKLPHFLVPLQPPKLSEAKDESAENDLKVSYAIDLSDIDDDELNREYFLQPRETMVKATMWFQENAPYLEEQRRKRAEKQRLKEELAKQPKRARRGQRKIFQRTRRMPWHTRKTDCNSDDENDEDEPRRISKKINYAALDALVGSAASPGFPADTANASADSGENSLPMLSAPGEPNPLLEKTVRPKAMITSVSSPALLQARNRSSEEEASGLVGIDNGEPIEEEEDYEEVEEEEEEYEADWTEGNDLW